jgi:uncharacterized membrane protein
MKLNLKKELIVWVGLAIPVVYLLLMWDKIPMNLPTHFDIHGQVNGYSSKYLVPVISIGIYILFLIIPLIDPRKANYKIFEGSYFVLRMAVVLLLCLINLLTMINSIYHNINLGMLVFMIIFILIAVMGNYLGNIRHNYFIGIRVPWTLNNEEIWTRTHRMAGKLWVAGGLSGIVCLLIFKNPNYIDFGIFACIILIPIVYSFMLHLKMNSKSMLD